MPSKSKAQANLMRAASHDPAFAKKVGVPASVAEDFTQADKGKRFKRGGRTQESTEMSFMSPEPKKGGKIRAGNRTAISAPNAGIKFKDGGYVAKKLFGGKESYNEEFGEAKAVAGKKITPNQFVAGEKSEGKKEAPWMKNTAKNLASGKVTPAQYAKKEAKEPKTAKFARGGGVEQRGKTKGRIV